MAKQEPIRGGGSHITPRGPASEIPDKLYFRIGDVARLCDVPAYVLRFWEGEFPQLKPNKGGTGQRLYRRRDVEMALRVKQLLYNEGYTIPGARQLLKSEQKHKAPQLVLPGAAEGVPDIRQLKGLRRELEAIVAMLSKPAGKPVRSATKTVQPIRARSSMPGSVVEGSAGISLNRGNSEAAPASSRSRARRESEPLLFASPAVDDSPLE